MALCRHDGGACERETDYKSGLCSKHRPKEQDVSATVKKLTDEVVMEIAAGSTVLLPEDYAKLPPEIRKIIDDGVKAGKVIKMEQDSVLIDNEDFQEQNPGYKPPTPN